MKLFDSHCHLDDKIYDKDFKDILSRADNSGVSGIMIVGVDKKSSERAVTLAESKPGLYASVGFHPHDAKECSKEALQFLIKLTENRKGLKISHVSIPKPVLCYWAMPAWPLTS